MATRSWFDRLTMNGDYLSCPTEVELIDPEYFHPLGKSFGPHLDNIKIGAKRCAVIASAIPRNAVMPGPVTPLCQLADETPFHIEDAEGDVVAIDAAKGRNVEQDFNIFPEGVGIRFLESVLIRDDSQISLDRSCRSR